MNSVRAREFEKSSLWPQMKLAAGRQENRRVELVVARSVARRLAEQHPPINCSFDWPRDNTRGVEAIGVGLQKEQKEMIGDGKEAYHGRTEYSRIRDLSRS